MLLPFDGEVSGRRALRRNWRRCLRTLTLSHLQTLHHWTQRHFESRDDEILGGLGEAREIRRQLAVAMLVRPAPSSPLCKLRLTSLLLYRIFMSPELRIGASPTASTRLGKERLTRWHPPFAEALTSTTLSSIVMETSLPSRSTTLTRR
jgi:hypothetical protein